MDGLKGYSISFIALLLLSIATSGAQKKDSEITPTELAKLVPSDVAIETTFTANITKGSFRDIIIIGVSRKPPIDWRASSASYAAMISFDHESNEWKNVYYEYRPFAPLRGIEVITGPVLPDRDVAIFAHWQGSGSFLEYVVVGYVDDVIKILLKREDLGRGEIEIQGDQIIEQESDCAVVYKWSGKSLVGTPLNMEPIPPLLPYDKLVQYRVGEDGSIFVDEKEVVLPVGGRLIFQRIGCNEPCCNKPWARDFYCYPEILERKSREGLIAKKIGTTTVTMYARYTIGAKDDTITVEVIEPKQIEH